MFRVWAIHTAENDTLDSSWSGPGRVGGSGDTPNSQTGLRGPSSTLQHFKNGTGNWLLGSEPIIVVMMAIRGVWQVFLPEMVN